MCGETACPWCLAVRNPAAPRAPAEIKACGSARACHGILETRPLSCSPRPKRSLSQRGIYTLGQMASPKKHRQPRAQRLEKGNTNNNLGGIPRQSATSRRGLGSDSASAGGGGTFKSRMGRLLTRRSSIAGVLACIFLLAAVGNFHWAEMEMEQRAHDTRENGNNRNGVYGGGDGYGFRQKIEGSTEGGSEGHNNNNDDDVDGNGREESNAAKGGGASGIQQRAEAGQGGGGGGSREGGLSKDSNAAGVNGGKKSESASGKNEYGLFNWRRYSWSGLRGSAISQDKV